MSKVKINQNEDIHLEYEVHVEIDFDRFDNKTIVGYGTTLEDAARNVIDEINKFIVQAEIKGKEAIALVHMNEKIDLEEDYC